MVQMVFDMSFKGDLAFSRGFVDEMALISSRYFGDSFLMCVENDVLAKDKLGIDFYVRLVNEREYRIDSKVDRYANDRIPLEIWSNEEAGKEGWGLKLNLLTDYVYFYKLQQKYALVMGKSAIHTYINANMEAFPQLRAKNPNYTSVCLAATKKDLLTYFGTSALVGME